MSINHILLAVVGGIALVTAASAQAHTVCDEYGRCWEQADPGEAIVNGIIGGFIGHHRRDDDWDHHNYRHHDDWDHHHHHDDYDED